MEQEKSPPCSLHVPTSFLPSSHATLGAPVWGEEKGRAKARPYIGGGLKRGHDPDRVETS
jgi:hypothetical protein